jgi:excisionase family DNA binding protein
MTLWLTPGEAARRLGVSRSGAVWFVDTRRVKAVKTPTGRRLISARDVERLRAERGGSPSRKATRKAAGS